MRNLRWGAAAAAVAALAVALPALVPADADRAYTSENLVRNRGFENCTRCEDGAGAVPDRWVVAVPGVPGVSWSTLAARTGVAGVRLEAQPSEPVGLVSDVTEVGTGQSFEAMVWMRADPSTVGTPADVFVEFLGDDGEQVDLGHTSVELGAEWQKVIVWKTPKSAARLARVAIYTPAGIGLVDVDDTMMKSYVITPT